MSDFVKVLHTRLRRLTKRPECLRRMLKARQQRLLN